MKKMISFTIAVIVLTAICVLGCGVLMTPQPALLSEFMAVGDVFYGATMTDDDVEFYMVDQEGQVTDTFATEQDGSLEAVMADGDDFYLSMRDLGSSTIEKWENGKSGTVVATLEQGMLQEVLELTMWQDDLYVVGTMVDGVSLGIYRLVEGAFELERLHNLESLDVADVVFANDALLVMTQSGDIHFVREDTISLVQENFSGVLIHNGDVLACYNWKNNTKITYSSDEGKETIVDMPITDTVKNLAGGDDLWAVATDSLGYSYLLHIDASGEIQEHSVLTGTMAWYVNQGKSMLWICLGAVVLLVLAIMGTAFIMKKSKRLVLKMVCMTVWFVCLLGAAVYFIDATGLVFIAKNTWFIGTAAVLSLIYTIVIYRMFAPLKKMAIFAEEIWAGDYAQQSKYLRNDEIGRMGRSLNGVASLLEQTHYRNRKAMRAYHRFVPKDIQNILGKSSVLELESGQATTLSTVFGVVSVSNRHEVRNHAKDETYTGWMMHALNTISGVAKNHNAVPTGTACSLQGVNLLYHEDPNNAMTYGIELFSRQRGGSAYASMPTNYIFMLHHGDAIYGMGGDADQAFMFLVSQELEMLGNYQDRMGGAGVRMVMTEQAKNQMTCPMETRYLGFIGEGTMRFKMYEVLNVLGDTERQLKKQTADDFAKGLQLYYKNDFYLARNQFSAIVKKNPTDGVARWYVFACERAFQNGGANNPYGLFSDVAEVDELLEKPISYV